MMTRAGRIAALVVTCAGASAAEPSPEAVRKALPVERGLVIHVGANGGELVAALLLALPERPQSSERPLG